MGSVDVQRQTPVLRARRPLRALGTICQARDDLVGCVVHCRVGEAFQLGVGVGYTEEAEGEVVTRAVQSSVRVKICVRRYVPEEGEVVPGRGYLKVELGVQIGVGVSCVWRALGAEGLEGLSTVCLV